MTRRDLTDDLAWWRAHRGRADPREMRELLERLSAWKAQHDQDRAGQPGPFLQLAWDAVFGDEHGRVVKAIDEIETALARAPEPRA